MGRWKPFYPEIIEKYKSGLSPSDIAKQYNCGRTTIKNIVALQLGLRSMSEAGKLAATQGKKDKALSLLIKASRTTNRFNPKKSPGKGENHPCWIKDRTKLKQKRLITEEREFFKEMMAEKQFKCELTGLGGRLSVHHINGVWSNPELRYTNSNCIVILKPIHLKFHTMYGNRATEADWNEYIINKEYEDIIYPVKKKNYIPFEDKTGRRYGRLLIIKKSAKKWECRCDCGNITFVSTGNLKNTFSCGCLLKELHKIRLINNPIWLLSPASKKGYKHNRNAI